MLQAGPVAGNEESTGMSSIQENDSGQCLQIGWTLGLLIIGTLVPGLVCKISITPGLAYRSVFCLIRVQTWIANQFFRLFTISLKITEQKNSQSVSRYCQDRIW